MPERDESSDFDLERRKYLIPKDITLGNFVTYIRKCIKLNKNEAMFVLVKGVLPPVSATMETLYSTHVNDDRLLHLVLKKENTFG